MRPAVPFTFALALLLGVLPLSAVVLEVSLSLTAFANIMTNLRIKQLRARYRSFERKRTLSQRVHHLVHFPADGAKRFSVFCSLLATCVATVDCTCSRISCRDGANYHYTWLIL